MQRANCTVRLGGDANNTVEKKNASAAEIAVLLAVHGEGSVVNVQPITMDKTPHSQERGFLSTTYGHHVVDRLFPGEFSKLPVSLSEIRFGGEEEEDLKTADNADEVAEDVSASPVTPAATAEDEDEKILRDSVMVAISKQAIRDIAKENDIDLSDVADKMDTLRSVLLSRLFPAAKEG